MIGGYEANGLYEALSAIGEGAPMVERIACTVLGRDADGTVWVRVPGGPDRTPLTSTTVEPVEGHVIYVEFDGTQAIGYGDETSPSVGETTVRKIVEPVEQSAREAGANADNARTAAEEAKAVAGAVGQHFFADSNGVHVTESPNMPDTDHNVLVNAYGILLRKALANMVSLTRGAIAFYDGQGNEDENITALFGSDGARVGTEGKYHVEIQPNGLALGYGDLTPYELRFRAVYDTVETGENVDLAVDLPYTRDFGDTLVYFAPSAEESWQMFPQGEGTVEIDTGDAKPEPELVIPENLEQYITYEDGVLTISEDASELIQEGYNWIAYHYTVTTQEETDQRRLGMYVGGRGTLPLYLYEGQLPEPEDMPSVPSVAISSSGAGNLYIDSETAIPISSGEADDYTDLANKPSIEGVTLLGDKTFPDLGIFIDAEEQYPQSDDYALDNTEIDALWNIA